MCYITSVNSPSAPPRDHGVNTLVTIAGSAFAPLAALATAPILAHGLSVDGRGAVAAVTAPLLLATTIGTIGIPASVTYHVARGSSTFTRLLVRGALLVSGSALVVTLLVVLLSGWFAGGDERLGELVRIAACAVLPSLLVLVLQAGAAGTGQWRLVATERFLTAAVRLGGIGVLSLGGSLTVDSAAAVLALSPVVGGLAYVGLLRGYRAWTTAHNLTSAASVSARSMASYGARVWVGTVSGALLLRLDQAILTPLVGVEALGLYVVAVTVSELPRVISDAARDVSFSADAASRSDERLARTARLASTAVLLVSTLLALGSGWLVPWAFGSDFADAVPVALVLLAATCVASASTIAGAALIARGRPGIRSLAFVAGCVVNVLVLLSTVPLLGVMGAAVGTLAGVVVIAVVNAVALHRLLHVDTRRFVGLRSGDVRAAVGVFRRRLRGGTA